HGFECGDGWRNDRFKEAPREMQSTEQGVDRLNTCEGLGVPQGIDRARMPAARQYHQALITHMDHEGLVVVDERVGLPGAVDFRIVYREALFEVRAAMNLAGDEDQPLACKVTGIASIVSSPARTLRQDHKRI